MSTSFSANQYQNAFTSKKLGNYEVPHTHTERPRPMDGSTKVIANDRGHLKQGIPRSRTNPWGNFIGTWDIPKKIPGNCAGVPTARTTYAQEKMKVEAEDANQVLSGDIKNTNRRVMRAGSTEPVSRTQAMTSPALEGHRSGAAAPGSKMLAEKCNAARPASREYRASLTPMQKTPSPAPRMDYVTSPIPGVPDLPEVLAMEAQRAMTPKSTRAYDGLSAL